MTEHYRGFIGGYLEALAFTEFHCDAEKLADATMDDLAPEFLNQCVHDCIRFQARCSSLLARAYECPNGPKASDGWYDEPQAGRDFWFTRCGHGVGYWDRDQLKDEGLGDRLTALCGHGTQFPNVDVYRGDDGKVYGI